MTTLRTAAQQALAFTMRDFATMRDFEAARAVLHDDLRVALKQEEEASAWLAERKEYWRKEKEKIQATNALRAALAQQTLNAPEECEHKADGWYAVQRVAGVTRVWPMTEAQALRAALAQQAEPQDAELSAALGWPGGISEPVLDRKTLLRQVADLRAALTQQAEPVAVAERERIAAQWDGCVTHQLDTFGPVDIGASIRAGELVEPVATVAENATTQQRVVETPPSDYRRGYWDGFNIGKREGRIEAEDALAQQAEPLSNQCGETCERAKLCAVCASKLAEPVEPVQEPAGYWDGKFKFGASILYEVPQQSLFGFKYCNEPLYTAPLQRKSVEGEKK